MQWAFLLYQDWDESNIFQVYTALLFIF